MKNLYLFFVLFSTIFSFGQTKKTAVKLSVSKNDTLIYNYNTVQVKPEFPGAGNESMYFFFKKNFVTPQELIESKTTKKIFVTFVVEKDGSLSNIKILRGLSPDADKETIRVLKAMPKWLPAEQDGYHVRCLYAVPFSIPLDD
ncbi:hypothetical protein HKT18_11305 [Flavobacterium sp. IMCC34852]|uniref:TonB C-terminal domain-containing protein n=1 Tax=Flavobacterium rivulicola TaxID=2732161 RepID=A0A7Y3RA97_9FLAO|nr:energy transducer TonB [Flavobacterium sp. IMCC34852]NNT72804.1 hypothetical protein [Flavobacterium sp. IMCC34852]